MKPLQPAHRGIVAVIENIIELRHPLLKVIVEKITMKMLGQFGNDPFDIAKQWTVWLVFYVHHLSRNYIT